METFNEGHLVQHRKNLSPFRSLARGASFCVSACRFAAVSLFQTARTFDRSLAEAAGNDAAAFSLPWIRAERAMRERLKVFVPGRRLGNMLAEWVRDGEGRVWNTLRFFAGAGDWSGLTIDFTAYNEFKDMRALAEFGEGYRDSPQYRFRLGQLERNELAIAVNTVPIDGVERLDAYFDRYLRLLDSIRRDGLLRQDEVRRRPAFDAAGKLGQAWYDRDISVAVGPEGEIFRLQRANHRSAAAMVLDLPKVPAEVGLVHRDWLRTTLAKHPGVRPTEALTREIGGVFG